MKERAANPYPSFNGWGLPNFESGGESQILEVPHSNIETLTYKNAKSHSQNLEVNKDIYRESSLDDTKEEGTYGANAPTRPHVHLSEMDEDALLCSLAAYRTEQQLAGGHLHIPGNTGTCCLQCEHDALEPIIEEKQET